MSTAYAMVATAASAAAWATWAAEAAVAATWAAVEAATSQAEDKNRMKAKILHYGATLLMRRKI